MPPRKKMSSAARGTRKCIIIGGGLAGLAAAYRATQKGWHVDLFEAHPRLGGRVCSYRFPHVRYGHLVCELGGEWIGKDHSSMQRLAHRFALLPLLPHQYSYSFWNAKRKVSTIYPPGKWPFSPALRKIFTKFGRDFASYSLAQQRKLDLRDWWTQLKLLGFPNDALLKRDLMDSTDFGETIRQTSAYAAATEYLGSEADTSDEMDFKIPGGNIRLIHALESAIGPASIHKHTPVKAVIQRGSRVEVRYGNGQKLAADACICTVPASCLRHIQWDPPLPPSQLEAANQLQYARITKTAVLFAKRFWDTPKKGGFAVFTNRVSDFCFESTYLQPEPGGILCSYAIGDKADDIASEPSEQAVGKWITEDVKSATARILHKPNIIDAKMQAWQQQSWITGAYAFYRPGQWFTVRPILQRPFHHVQFAGEHIADEQGFMEGAVDTGEQAADNL
jgi:monoamine oxidase